jgi:hypothetical protein
MSSDIWVDIESTPRTSPRTSSLNFCERSLCQVCVFKKSLRPLFSSNEESEKSHRPSSGCSSIQRSESIESTLWISPVEGFLRHKKPTPSILFISRDKNMLVPSNVWLKPTENFRYVSRYWVNARFLWEVHLSVHRKKPLSSIKRGRKSCRPLSKNFDFESMRNA